MVRCDYCEKNVDSLPWTCKRCGQTFCDKHRLPENHYCSRINQKNFFEPLTKRTIRELLRVSLCAQPVASSAS